MSKVTKISDGENQRLQLENDALKAEMARYKKRFIIIPMLQSESRVAGWIWSALNLTAKLMDCSTEEEMMEFIKDAETVSHGAEQSGEVEGMGLESDVADYMEKEITDDEKTKIKESFKIINGGKE